MELPANPLSHQTTLASGLAKLQKPQQAIVYS
jgi:hypothetical protein